MNSLFKCTSPQAQSTSGAPAAVQRHLHLQVITVNSSDDVVKRIIESCTQTSNAQLNQNVSVLMDVGAIAARGKDTRKGTTKDKFNCNHLCKGRSKRRGQKEQQEPSTDDRRCFSSDRRGHIAQDCRMYGVSDIPSIPQVHVVTSWARVHIRERMCLRSRHVLPRLTYRP